MKGMLRSDGLARSRLVALLQKAHAGELAAAHAYRGHWRSLKDQAEIERVRRIEREELVHREGVARMLKALGAGPSRPREAVFGVIGLAIAAACRVGGWLPPMYGAGWLESGNVEEYEDAARLAKSAGRLDFVPELLEMAEVEREHERYFRDRVRSHWLGRRLPLWREPPRR